MRDMNIDEQSRGRSWGLARICRGLERLRGEVVSEVRQIVGQRVFVRISGRDARAPVSRRAYCQATRSVGATPPSGRATPWSTTMAA